MIFRRFSISLVVALSLISSLGAEQAIALPINLCVAYDTGGPGDRSYNDALLAGLTKAKKTLNFTFEGFITDGSLIDRERRVRAMITKGCSSILLVGSGYANVLKMLAIEFPQQQFLIMNDGTVANLNVASLIFADNQVGYLAGSAAARMSSSGKIALLSSISNPNLESGFTLGATLVKKKIKISKVNNSTNLVVSVNKLMSDGVDTIFIASTGSDDEIFAAVVKFNESKKKSTPEVGVITIEPDQYLTISTTAKKYLLAAISKRVDNAILDVATSAINTQPIIDVLDPVVGIYGRRYGITGGNIEFSYWSNRLLTVKAEMLSAAKRAAKL
jgi:basic membrane protein A